MTEILESIFRCDLKNLKISLHFGKKVNCEIPGTEGCTPLHLVVGIENAAKNKDAVLTYLLQSGADPNARSYDDLTPVHIASMWNNYKELERLLQHGGNPWLIDNENKNSFDLAADNNAYEAFQLLNKYLADGKLDFRKHTVHQRKSVNFKDSIPDQSVLSDTLTSGNTAFLSANENLYISSTDDESFDCFLNVSKILKKSFTKCHNLNQKVQKNLSENVRSKFPLTKKLFRNSDDTDDVNHTLSSKEPSETDHNVAAIFTSDDTEIYNFSESETLSKTTAKSNVVHIDNESGVVLVEKDSSSCSMSSRRSSVSLGVDLNDTDWKSCRSDSFSDLKITNCEQHSILLFELPEEYKKLNNSAIFQALKDLGDKPGPVSDSTRDVYLRRLFRLKSGCDVSCHLPSPKYCREVYMFLNNNFDTDRVQKLMKTMVDYFNSPNPNEKWREGNQRCCFNYFLLDPRVTQNLPLKLKQFSFEAAFLTFLNALFYIGKGKKGRPYSHLVEASRAVNSTQAKNKKVAHILDIWNSGHGVISLHCFNNSVPIEAYTQEACIIEAIGLENLANVKSGDYYGVATKWKRSWKRQVGVSLLHKALQIFIIEGEKQIMPKDVKTQ